MEYSHQFAHTQTNYPSYWENSDTYFSTNYPHDLEYEIKQPRKRKRVITLESRRCANIRERRRMLNLNAGFNSLREKIPKFEYERQLSRIETLRLAIYYIKLMSNILNNS